MKKNVIYGGYISPLLRYLGDLGNYQSPHQLVHPRYKSLDYVRWYHIQTGT